MAALGAIAAVASVGMNILGAISQSNAQRQAGEVAYQQALQRQQLAQLQADQQRQALEVQAQQQEQAANAEQATAQRAAIEQKRQATIAAGRARAVMAASGASVDENILAGILGEGDYASKVALYQGDVSAQGRRFQATLNHYQGNVGTQIAGYEGEAALTSGINTRNAYNAAAGSTLATGIGRGLISSVSLADKYGFDFGGVPARTPDMGAAPSPLESGLLY